MSSGANDGTTRPSVGGLHLLRVVLVVALCALTASLYVANAREFAFLSDDAFISYRYSRHFVEGLGLVWNAGEPPVEGYTSFLWVWVGVLALRLGLAPDVLSTGVTMVAGGLILVLLFLFSGRRRGHLHPLGVIAPLCLATNRTFVAWSTGGLATQLFSLAVLVSALVFLRERRRAVGAPVGSALAFAFATLVRPEGVLFAFCAGCLFLWEVAIERRRRTRALVLWVGLYFAIVLAHLLWRHAYYGYWLPNTYYAKVSGRVRIDEGLEYLGYFLYEYFHPLGGATLLPLMGWALPLVLVPAFLRRRAEDFLFLLFLVVFTGYVSWVGGDWMEFRFLNVVLPYLYLSIVEGLGVFSGLFARNELVTRLLHERVGLAQYLPSSWMPRLTHLFKGLAGIALLLLIAVTARTTLRSQEELWPRGFISDVRRMGEYSRSRRSSGEALRGWVEGGLLPADLRIAVGGSGALPYFSRLYTIDLLGWNDVVVAHSEIVNPGRIGHEHEASPDYLREKRVDLIDAVNHLVWKGDPAAFPRRADKYSFTGDLACFEVEPGAYLVFGTYLDDAALARRLEGLRRVY